MIALSTIKDSASGPLTFNVPRVPALCLSAFLVCVSLCHSVLCVWLEANGSGAFRKPTMEAQKEYHVHKKNLYSKQCAAEKQDHDSILSNKFQVGKLLEE